MKKILVTGLVVLSLAIGASSMQYSTFEVFKKIKISTTNFEEVNTCCEDGINNIEDTLRYHNHSKCRQSAQVAVYSGPGTSHDSIIAFENFLDWKGLTWEEVSHTDVNQRNLSFLYDAIYVPGGRFDQYGYYINESGTNHIRELVRGGGGYIGICGGAYYAASITQWDDITFRFSLKLFNGTASGPLWTEFFMVRLNMVGDHSINIYEPPLEWVLYDGGPAFYPNPDQEMNIVATYDGYNDEPAVISFQFDEGRVVLISPHPEIEEDSNRDGTNAAQQFFDIGSDWRFLWTTLDWVMGWNISRPPLGTGMLQDKEVNPSIFNSFNRLMGHCPLFRYIIDENVIKGGDKK